ncbi:Rieske 2Fe-2S domain-containing protein [Methylocystis sp. 9N]|uniref:Rieske 2Fe-2S domain-containing protein n=1 Tax=Methylocystis borbori TaxID=3118750 RepID=A0ABU7XLQ1_9HYPH
MGDEVKVYVICAATAIGRGQAKPFSLSRVSEEGETKPFSIFAVRTLDDQYVGYVNVCPHQGAWLNIGEGKFFSEDGRRLRCGRHKAEFEIETGVCVKGPCKDKIIEPIPLVVIGNDLCLCGIELAEEELSAFDDHDDDDTMEIMISPD